MSTQPAKPDPQEEAMLELAGALGNMRDALTTMALLLRDYQFEQDHQQRAQATRESDDALQKAKQDHY